MSEEMRTGDHVLHNPSGEEWIVAWADYATGYMAPCGWPTCEARIADCTIISRASDENSDDLVEKLLTSGRTDAHRASQIRAALSATVSS